LLQIVCFYAHHAWHRVMWLKILYDSSPVVKVLFWVFVIYLIVGVTFSMYGWIGIGVLIAIIIAMGIGIWLETRPPK